MSNPIGAVQPISKTTSPIGDDPGKGGKGSIFELIFMLLQLLLTMLKNDPPSSGSDGCGDDQPPFPGLGGNPAGTQNLVAPTGGTGEGGDLSPQQVATTYGDEIAAASKETGVPPDILAGMIWQESKGRANSPGGGLMQVGPGEWTTYGGGDINNAGDNIMAGAKYLAYLHAQFGDWNTALRAYNSGPLGVDPSNLHATPMGTGDPTYVDKVNQAAQESGL